MINSKEILYSKGKNDECYTPEEPVKIIKKYISDDLVIWCPFDKEESNFVKILSKTNKVIFTHIENGQDFYNFEPKEHFDIIVSNPPFTNKRKIFERALSFNKPFALIMSNTWLNDSAPKIIFKNKDLQLLLFKERIQFINENLENNKKITFSSSYFCYNLLPKQIIIESLKDIKKGEIK